MAVKRDDKYALAKARREKAFSTPIDLAAAAKKQMGVTVENDRVTDFGKPTQDEGIAAQMLRRYTVNIPKGAYAVGRDTVSGGEAAYKPAPAWMRLLYGSSPSTDMLYNVATNEKFNDALAPTDLVGGGLGGLAKGAVKIATSKGGKAAIAGLIAGEASGLRDTEEAEAFPLKSAFNLAAPAKVSGRIRTEADRIIKQINQTTSKRFGSGEGIGQEDIKNMVASYLYDPMNRLYIDRILEGGKVPGGKAKELVGAHETGMPPSLGGPRNPTRVQSGELNRLEQAMREAGEIPKSSMDILNWAIKSHPKHSGKSIIDMLREVGT
jgi:hypothetical protein